MKPLFAGWIGGGVAALAITIPAGVGDNAAILIGLACGCVGVALATRLWPHA